MALMDPNPAKNSVQPLQLQEKRAAIVPRQKEELFRSARAIAVVPPQSSRSQSVGLAACHLSFAPSAVISADLLLGNGGGSCSRLEGAASYQGSRSSAFLMPMDSELTGSASTLNSPSGRNAIDASSGQGSGATAGPQSPAGPAPLLLKFLHPDPADL